MSLSIILCSCNSLVGNAAFLRTRINFHTKSIVSGGLLPKHFNTSASLSLQKDTKPGTLKKHAVAVNQKVSLLLGVKYFQLKVVAMRRMGDRMIIADKVPPNYELVYRFGVRYLFGSPHIEF